MMQPKGFKKGNLVYIIGNKKTEYRISSIEGMTEEGNIIYKIKNNNNFSDIKTISEDRLIKVCNEKEKENNLSSKDKEIIGKY